MLREEGGAGWGCVCGHQGADGGAQMRQYFHKRKKSVRERIGRAERTDFTLEIPGPATKLGKPPRSNFQHLSQLIHHGVIAVSPLSQLWTTDEPQLNAVISIPYL